MSDDDRMDRARRIRRMREGDENRPGEKTEDENTGDRKRTVTDDDTTTERDDASGGDDATDDDDKLEMEWGDPGRSTASGSDAEQAIEGSPGDAGSTETAGAGDTGSTETGDSNQSETGGINAPLPGTDQLEEALGGSEAGSETETVAPDTGDEAGTADAEEETRVLEFTLGDEHYCLDIEYIEEIVKEETVTRVPNTPAFVEGVVDLRGQITTILNPKVTVGKEETMAGDLIVVFDGEAFEDQGHIGWVVDDVRQVSLVTESDVNEAPMEQEQINGVIDRDDSEEFVIWTTPELALEEVA